MHPYRRSRQCQSSPDPNHGKRTTHLLHVDHDEAIDLRVGILVEPAVCQRHAGRFGVGDVERESRLADVGLGGVKS